MKIRWLLILALLGCGIAPAQEFELDTNALRQAFDAAESWARENLDEDVLRALQQLDREKVEQFLRDYQKGLQGEYVLDLAALKDAATVVLPLLEAREETLPYAVWLKSQLDYLDVAEELRRLPRCGGGIAPRRAAAENCPGSTAEASAESWPRGRAKNLGAQSLDPAHAERRGALGAEVEAHFCERAGADRTDLDCRGGIVV